MTQQRRPLARHQAWRLRFSPHQSARWADARAAVIARWIERMAD